MRYNFCKQRVVNYLYMLLSALFFCPVCVVTSRCESRVILTDFPFELSARS
jgi:hypothetical protein